MVSSGGEGGGGGGVSAGEAWPLTSQLPFPKAELPPKQFDREKIL